ncbi:putative signal transducing protein [Oceanithermus profundus]|uniref:DUF2007 domain-containing protein n=1 Tax=Oceanithermus profundus (strain DSM 14977 / NBRC 100410 / VKM B-2274 / 506) TaxID=670487 RepID=E4U4T8_OCEP5|nr:hypothetical protein [Oceanithermus profundus]ADR37155.1 hypothetical protein Ocepr_1702 [Oceanithermus profundus DSM 14977]
METPRTKRIGGRVYAFLLFGERPIVDGFAAELRAAGIPAEIERPPVELEGMLPTMTPTSLWVPEDQLEHARRLLRLEDEEA